MINPEQREIQTQRQGQSHGVTTGGAGRFQGTTRQQAVTRSQRLLPKAYAENTARLTPCPLSAWDRRSCHCFKPLSWQHFVPAAPGPWHRPLWAEVGFCSLKRLEKSLEQHRASKTDTERMRVPAKSPAHLESLRTIGRNGVARFFQRSKDLCLSQFKLHGALGYSIWTCRDLFPTCPRTCMQTVAEGWRQSLELKIKVEWH